MGTCDLCGRDVPTLTRHHLVPRKRHNASRKRRMGASLEDTANLCRACHDQLHLMFTHRELEGMRTTEELSRNERVRKYLAWIRGKPPGLRPRTRGGRSW